MGAAVGAEIFLAACAVITGVVCRLFHGFFLGFKLFACAVAAVSFAFGDQFFCDFMIDMEAFGLTKHRTVPVQAHPFEAVINHLDRRFRMSFPVRVLDSEDELAAVMARVKPVEESRAGISKVHKASR